MKSLFYNQSFHFNNKGDLFQDGELVKRVDDYIDTDLGNGLKRYPVKKLWLLAHFEVNIPCKYIDDIVFAKSMSKVMGMKAGHSMWFKSKVPAWWDGFYVIPGFCGYAINEDGVVISLRSGLEMGTGINAYGYPTNYTYDPDKGKHRSVCRHILLAKVFCNNPDPQNKQYINHKDGNKLNYSLDNLEWVSAKENSLHAYRNGLRNDNIPFVVMDHRTNTQTTTYSKSEAFRFIGFDKPKRWVRETANGKVPVLFKGRYEMQPLQQHLQPWHYAKDKRAGSVAGPYQAKDIATGVVYEGRTMEDLSKQINLPMDTIHYYIKCGEEVARRGFLFRVKSEDPWPTDIEAGRTAVPVKIKAVNQSTGEEKVFDSISAASRFTGISRRTIGAALVKKKPSSGWFISYYECPNVE